MDPRKKKTRTRESQGRVKKEKAKEESKEDTDGKVEQKKGCVDVKTLTGQAKMKSPEGCKPDAKLALQGKGTFNGLIKIEIPRKQSTRRQQELLRAMKRRHAKMARKIRCVACDPFVASGLRQRGKQKWGNRNFGKDSKGCGISV